MKNKIFTIGIIIFLIIIPYKTTEPIIVEKEQPAKLLTHRQTIWMAALEWCESSGNKDAINKMDLDGTPSYYSFQFKPTTFLAYGVRYKLIEPGTYNIFWIMEKLKDYDLQSRIVEKMILDPKVKWEREFPDCVRKLGRPPKN